MNKKVVFERDLFAVTQKAVIYNPESKKFLLLKASPDQDGRDILGDWEVAGGHIDFSDKDTSNALHREIQEEIGTDVSYSIRSIFYLMRLDYDGQKRVAIGALVEYIDGKIHLSEEHTEYKWESSEEIEENKIYKPWLKELTRKAQEEINIVFNQ